MVSAFGVNAKGVFEVKSVDRVKFTKGAVNESLECYCNLILVKVIRVGSGHACVRVGVNSN